MNICICLYVSHGLKIIIVYSLYMPPGTRRFKTRIIWIFSQEKRAAGSHERCKILDKDLPYWSPPVEYRCVSFMFSSLGHTMPHMGRF